MCLGCNRIYANRFPWVHCLPALFPDATKSQRARDSRHLSREYVNDAVRIFTVHDLNRIHVRFCRGRRDANETDRRRNRPVCNDANCGKLAYCVDFRLRNGFLDRGGVSPAWQSRDYQSAQRFGLGHVADDIRTVHHAKFSLGLCMLSDNSEIQVLPSGWAITTSGMV